MKTIIENMSYSNENMCTLDIVLNEQKYINVQTACLRLLLDDF